MREIWKLVNDYWALPLGVEWPEGQRDVAFVRLGGGIQLLQCQREAGEEKLLASKAERLHGGKFRILAIDLKKVAEPTKLDDPEMVVEWRPWPRVVRYANKGGPASSMDNVNNRAEFIHEFCKTGWIMDPLQAEITWNAFARHCLHWLLVESRPVDLGFIRLHALPYRPNWKEIVMGWSFNQPEVPIEEWLKRGELGMWNRIPKRWYWSLDIEYLENWWDESLRIEQARLNERRNPHRFGQLEKYYGAFCRFVHQKTVYAKRVYNSFVSAIARPYVVVNEERNARGVVTRKRGAIRPPDPPDLVPIAYDIRRKSVTIPAQVGDPAKAMGAMSDVLPVQSQTGDVRNAGDESGV